MLKNKLVQIALVLVCLALAVGSRLISHTANMTLLFSSVLTLFMLLQNKKIALGVLLISLGISDIFIGYYNSIFFVYGGFVVAFLMASLVCKQVQQKTSLISVTLAAMIGSLVFYVVSNFGVWLVDGMYPHTISGLIECYVMAIPFYKNQFMADIIATPALFFLAQTILKFYGFQVLPEQSAKNF